MTHKENILVRRAHLNDAKAIHEAHMKSIRELCTKDYTSEQIAAWGGRTFNLEIREKNIREDYVWVLELDGKIEGFGHLKFLKEPEFHAYVQALYLTPKGSGKGHGTKILTEMIREVEKSKCNKLTLNSTLTSLPFYLKNSFVQVGPVKTELINGEQIPCIPMELRLEK